jgi:hypothetical protein
MKIVFRIRDVLIRIRSLHWIADPDPTLLSAAFQMKTKKVFFLLITYYWYGTFTSTLKDNPIHWIGKSGSFSFCESSTIIIHEEVTKQ